MQTQAMLQHEGWQDFVSVAVVIVSFKYRIEVSNSYERRVRFFIETASWTQFGRRECASWTQYSRRETASWTQYSRRETASWTQFLYRIAFEYFSNNWAKGQKKHKANQRCLCGRHYNTSTHQSCLSSARLKKSNSKTRILPNSFWISPISSEYRRFWIPPNHGKPKKNKTLCMAEYRHQPSTSCTRPSCQRLLSRSIYGQNSLEKTLHQKKKTLGEYIPKYSTIFDWRGSNIRKYSTAPELFDYSPNLIRAW